MDVFNILASVSHAVQTNPGIGGTTAQHLIAPIDYLWEQIIALNVVESLTFISFGSVCLFYGWRVFKILVVISFGLIGLVLGMLVTEKFTVLHNSLAGGLIGMGIMTVMSIPLMKWAVSILGACAGGVIAAGIWYALNMDPNYMFAGALTGIVAGGMLSFVVFKVAVMLFTGLGGSTLVVTGLLALFYMHPSTTEQVKTLVLNNKWFVPFAIIVPTALGLLIQNRMVKDAKDWNM